jgi:hypothetical protein
MSPVSRGRKPKKKSGKAAKAKTRKSTVSGELPLGGSVFDEPLSDAFDEFDGPRSPFNTAEPPKWFDPAIDRILDRAEGLLAAQSPRELEQMVAELLGAEMHRALNEERSGLWFEWLVKELIDSAEVRITEDPGPSDPAWAASWRLLYGLTSIVTPALMSFALETLALAREALPSGAAAGQPDWLTALPKIAATGDVQEMHDVYGTRFAVIAGYRYPGVAQEHMFLFDVDACAEVVLASAGMFDDAEQAAAAWRESLGEAAVGVVPTPVNTSERLLCLAYLDQGDDFLIGWESRAALDNYFRARRRIYELQKVLRKKRMPLPEAQSLFDDIEIEPEVEAFTAWYKQRHGGTPDPEVVEAVAGEWLEGALPGTSYSASPHRAKHRLVLISDWRPDPITEPARELLPEWVRWNAEQSGLSEQLTERAVAAATDLGDTEPSPADG